MFLAFGYNTSHNIQLGHNQNAKDPNTEETRITFNEGP